MSQIRGKILIDGITESGQKFRPSDWAERLSESVSRVGPDHRIRYSPYVQPILIEGHAALEIDPYLKEVNPRAYKQIIDFVKDNKLVVLKGSESVDFQIETVLVKVASA